MDLQGHRIDLVHSDVNMFVLLITMSDCDVLMLLQTDGCNRSANDILEFSLSERTIVWVERDHYMVGLVPLRADVAFLDELHDRERQVGVLRDVLTNTQPMIVSGQVYATAALLGSLSYATMLHFGVPEIAAEVVACLAAFLLRASAIIFDIRMGPPGEFVRIGKTDDGSHQQ